MPDLEMLLREVRPVPDPAWATRLDTRVAHRFPGPPPRWKTPLLALRDHLLALGTVATIASLLVVIVVAGVRHDGDSDDAMSTGSVAKMESAEVEAAATPDIETYSAESKQKSAAPTATTAATLPLTAAAAPEEPRDVKTTTSMTLTTTPDEVQSVSDRAIRVVDSLGGYVQSSEVNVAGSRASASLTLKIPAAKVDDGLGRLSKLAAVTSRTQQTQDFTDQRELLEARVRDARADREGLRARLTKATTDKERARLRALLDRATGRVTARQRDVAALGAEVAYADVDLTVRGKKASGAAVAKPGDRWTPGDALGDAGRVLEVIAGVLMIAFAVLLPMAVIGVLLVLLGRVATRHRRLRALETA